MRRFTDCTFSLTWYDAAAFPSSVFAGWMNALLMAVAVTTTRMS